MKRMMVLSLVLCLVLSLVACGGEKCRVCGKKATREYSYSGSVSDKVMIGNRFYVFYEGETDPLCDECYEIVRSELGESK